MYRTQAVVYCARQAPSSGSEVCHDGWVLCGVPGSTHYPDRRPMGFPFDRPYRAGVHSLDDFLTDNMAVQDITVKFDDARVEPPSSLLPGGASTSWMPQPHSRSRGTPPTSPLHPSYTSGELQSTGIETRY